MEAKPEVSLRSVRRAEARARAAVKYRAGRRLNPEEVTAVLAEFAAGKSIEEIARNHTRRVSVIQNQLRQSALAEIDAGQPEDEVRRKYQLKVDDLRPPRMLEERVADLEAQMTALQAQLKIGCSCANTPGCQCASK